MELNFGHEVPWICDKCNQELKLKKVTARYLEGSFEIELMKCPGCGMVYIDEELAMGKMLEVEKELEDK
jgi:Zn-finger nucleic acid-binding protein